MTSTPATPAGDDRPVNFHVLTPREQNRLRLLAQRYRLRRDTTLRPVADVVFDLRSRHGLQLSMGQVFELLGERAAR